MEFNNDDYFTNTSEPGQYSVDTGWAEDQHKHGGGFFGVLDHFFNAAVPIFVAAGGAIAGAGVVGGMMGAGAGAAAGGAAGAGAGAAGGGVGTAAGLGGMALDASIPSVFVTGSTAGAGGLGALGTAAAAGAGGVGLASMMNGSPGAPNTIDPSIPTVNVVGPQAGSGPGVFGGSAGTAGDLLGAGALGGMAMDPSLISGQVTPGGVSVPESSLPPLVPPILNQMPAGSVSLPSDGMASNPSTGGLLGGTPVSNIPTPNANDPDMPPGLPGSGVPGGSNPNNPLGGLGSLLSGFADYKMNQADKDYYQSLLNKMMGMYQPGTAEADLMQKQMEAKDAAAGRNSQYGVRATDLAAKLAGQRAQIMTSPTFGRIAEASRGHYDSSLASLSSMFGNASTGGTGLNNLINTGLNSGASWLSNLLS